MGLPDEFFKWVNDFQKGNISEAVEVNKQDPDTLQWVEFNQLKLDP